jgi:hypothetical protein
MICAAGGGSNPEHATLAGLLQFGENPPAPASTNVFPGRCYERHAQCGMPARGERTL